MNRSLRLLLISLADGAIQQGWAVSGSRRSKKKKAAVILDDGNLSINLAHDI